MTRVTDREYVIRDLWNLRRAEMVEWLIQAKQFTRTGAEQCADSFIATMAYAGLPPGSVEVPEP